MTFKELQEYLLRLWPMLFVYQYDKTNRVIMFKDHDGVMPLTPPFTKKYCHEMLYIAIQSYCRLKPVDIKQPLQLVGE